MTLSLHSLEIFLQAHVAELPLTLFVGLGTFLEEMLPFVPAPLLMTTAGTAVQIQGYGWLWIVWLALLGTSVKTFASWIFYWLGDKLEDVAIRKWGRFLGVKHADIEHIGQRFNGDWRDDIILLILRLMPFVPATPVSVVCGVIKINLRTFIWTTFIGFAFKNMLYLSLGFVGLEAFQDGVWWWEEYRVWLTWGAVCVVAGILLGLFWINQQSRNQKK